MTGGGGGVTGGVTGGGGGVQTFRQVFPTFT